MSANVRQDFCDGGEASELSCLCSIFLDLRLHGERSRVQL